MKKILFSAAVLTLGFSPSVTAQPGPIAKIYTIKVKAGKQAEFETAYKSHVEWHRGQKDSWTWDAWQIESGERAGQYVIVTPGHQWSDFDSRGEIGRADEAHAAQTLMPLVDSLEIRYSRAMFELSRLPQDMPDAALARVTDYRVKPGTGLKFLSVIRQAVQILREADWGRPVLWTQNLTGPGGVYSAVEFLPNWAALAEPEKSLLNVVNDKLGAMATADLFETFFDCVESSETQVVRYRKDLSYAPAAP